MNRCENRWLPAGIFFGERFFWVTVLVGGIVLTGCGGGSAETPVTPTPVTPVTPATPVTPTYSQTTSGVVYERSDVVAYTADFVPAAGLGNAQIGLGGVTASTAQTGAYSIKTTLTPSTNATMLTASGTGYMQSWYPWFPEDTAKAVTVGLYPQIQAVPRPGFVKGVTMMDAGGWMPKIYSEGLIAPTMERVRNTMSGNLVAHVDAFWVTRFDPATNSVSIGPDGWGMGTRAFYETVVGQAKSRGLQFMMLTTLTAAYPGDSALNANYKVRFSIPVSNTAFWDAFFAAWQPLLVERATFARDLGVEYLALGFNLAYLSRLEPSRWRGLVQAIRATGYTGKIVYFGLTSLDLGAFELSDVDPAFPALFDAIGINIVSLVTKTNSSEVLDKAQTRARMRSSVSAFLNTVTKYPVPIILRVTTPSVFGGVSSNEYIEPTIASNPISLQRTRDYQQQADAYQAIAEVINSAPAGNGRVMGLLSSGYWYRDDPHTSGLGQANDAAFDKSANTRGKPAEAVLSWWFQKW